MTEYWIVHIMSRKVIFMAVVERTVAREERRDEDGRQY